MKDARRQELLGALRRCVAAAEGYDGQHRSGFPLPFGLPEIDRVLPGRGLAPGAIHEVSGGGVDVVHGAAAAIFCAGVLARAPGLVLWVSVRRDLFMPALAEAGLAVDRVIHVEAGDAKTVLLVMEEALRHKGLAGVVGEMDGRIALTASRRLQLAAESSGALGLLLRRPRQGRDHALEPTAARTRWRVSALPSGPALAWSPATPGLARALWRLELLRAKGGDPRTFIVEACDAQGRLSLPADLADGSATQDHSLVRAAAG
jgi:protein ImuA